MIWYKELRGMCRDILFLIDFYEHTNELPDCNTCKKHLDCEYISWGDRVRRDCPLYESIEESDE